MRKLLLLMIFAGCAPVTAGAGAPTSPLDRFGAYRHAIEYELQPRIRGEACASTNVRDSEDAKVRDKGAITNSYLYEKAKTVALDSVKDMDGLLEVRGVFQINNDGNECVVVSGRPYRIISLRAAPEVGEPPAAATAKKAEANGFLSPNLSQ